MEIINLTGSTVTIIDDRGELIVSYSPRGHAETEVRRARLDTTGRVPVHSMIYSRPKNLPDPDRDSSKLYIVDEDVASAAKHRYDLLVIDEEVKEKRRSSTIFCKGLLNIV